MGAAANQIPAGLMIAAGLSDLARPVYPLFLFLFIVTLFLLQRRPFELKLYGVLLLVFYVLSSISVLAGAVDEFFFRIEYLTVFLEVLKGLIAVGMFWTGLCLFKDWISESILGKRTSYFGLENLGSFANDEQPFRWGFVVLLRSFIYCIGGILFGIAVGAVRPNEEVFNMIYHSLMYANRFFILSLIIYQMVLTLPFSAVLWLFGSARGRKILARWARRPSRLRIVCSALCVACPIAYGSVLLLNLYAN